MKRPNKLSWFYDNDDDDREEDGLVLDHLKHFMAPSEGLTLFRPQEKPDSTNGRHKIYPKTPNDLKLLLYQINQCADKAFDVFG